MEFVHDDIRLTYPTRLAEITLGQRIDFHEQYGREIVSRRELAQKQTDTAVRELSDTKTDVLEAVYAFSFFANFSLHRVQRELTIDHVITVYENGLRAAIYGEEQIAIRKDWEWQGSTWTIALTTLSPTSGFTFNELITSKELVRQMEKGGASTWLVLIHLCAMFFRKEGEGFDERFLEPDGERLRMMRDLPLDMALTVAFFLSSLMLTSHRPSQYSENLLRKASTWPGTLIDGDGFRFYPTLQKARYLIAQDLTL